MAAFCARGTLLTAVDIQQLQLGRENKRALKAYLHSASLANCGHASAETTTPLNVLIVFFFSGMHH